MRTTLTLLVAAALGAVAIAVPAAATTNTTASTDEKAQRASCAAQFEKAQRADMVSYRDYDAATWRRGHDPAAVSIFPQGNRYVGINAIMDAQQGHFTGREAVWAWKEMGRRVNGCHSAYIEYETTYDIPRVKYHLRADTVVSYEYEHGRWLGVLDQGTLLEQTTS